jgi:hypothetical protein
VTFVDISVRGTEAPIRLVRRVEGSCAVQPDGDGGAALVRVECASAPSVRFEIARERNEIVVRRESEAGADAGAVGFQVIARAVVPAGADVRVE